MNSSNVRLDDALSSLAGHLLQDHLGLQDGRTDHTVITTNQCTLADVGSPIPVPNLEQDVEMRVEEQRSDNKDQSMPSAGSAKQDELDKPENEDQHPMTVDVKSPSPTTGTEKCCWRGCELSFASVDDLMNHLTAEHVGSGKNHYECFWSGCERNGQNGFGSKQKVCRHLQVRILSGSVIHIDLLCDGGCIDAHGSQTIPVQALQTTFF
jgi:hypothetical protein